MPQPSQLSLEEQVFSRSYSSFLEELNVWYFLPPSDAEDALQTADVKCLEGLDVVWRLPSKNAVNLGFLY